LKLDPSVEMCYDWGKRRYWGKGMSSQSISRAGTHSRQALEYLTVRGFYTSAYAEIVQPERIFAVTDYFRRYWVPLLKPGPAWLTVALRQRCYWNQQRDWCVVSRETLAAECGVTARTVDNYLTLPLVEQFVLRRQLRYRRTADGHKQRDWTRYYLRLDEPLTPLHQAALAAVATQALPECLDSPDASPKEITLSVAQYLLDLGVEALWERIRTCEQDPAVQQAAEAILHPRTIQEILEDACRSTGASQETEDTRLALSRACDALYNRLVRPDRVQIATQYFRLSWLSLLGAARAWLILDLRSRCYLNHQEMELRDTCTVGGYAELANRLGVSISTIKTCVSQSPGPGFLQRLTTRRPGRGLVEMDFRVEMIDPLTPDDELRYRELVAQDQKPETSGSYDDQKLDSSGSLPSQETEFSPSLAQQGPGFSVSPDQGTQSAGSPGDQEPEFTSIGKPTKSQDLQDTKIPYNTLQPEKGHQQHQVLVRTSDDEDLPLAVAVGSLADILDDLEINEPARSKIADLAPPVSHVLAWLLESFSHEQIQNKLGFVISMLLSSYPPPPATEKLVMLSVRQWNEILVAAREIRQTGQTRISSPLVDSMDGVLERLGHLAPDQWPFTLPQTPPMPPTTQAVSVSSLASAKPETDRARAHLEGNAELQEARELWSRSLEDLRLQMPQSIFDTWLRDSQVIATSDGTLVIQVQSRYAVDWLENRLLGTVLRPLSRLAGREMQVRFEGRQ
jgi:hypothetical protein